MGDTKSFNNAYIAAYNASLDSLEVLRSGKQKSEWIDIDAYLQGSTDVHE